MMIGTHEAMEFQEAVREADRLTAAAAAALLLAAAAQQRLARATGALIAITPIPPIPDGEHVH